MLIRKGRFYQDDVNVSQLNKKVMDGTGRTEDEEVQVRMLEKDNQDFVGETMCIGLMASVKGAPFWVQAPVH